MLEYALHALSLGLCVMPASEDGKKQPLGNSATDRRWKHFQTSIPTEAKVREWYDTGLKNIGFVCGAVSGNLEVIDFDDADCYHEFKGAAASCGLGELVARIEAGYLEYSPKGTHWFYRCEEISGNLKLASREKKPDEKQHEKDKVQVMVETRGEGGFIIAAPSRGPVNPKGEYRLVSGSLDTIPTITPQERAELHHLAMSFDQMPKTLEYAEVNSHETKSGMRPGDDFAEQTTWDQILEPHGWKRCFTRGDETFWTRPGKQYGISATTNYAGSGLFYVFSSSTDFEPNRGFSKFAVHTYLNHHGDFEAAARALGEDGFGSDPEEEHIEDRPLKFKRQTKTEVDPESLPAELMDVPGVVNDMQEWINACAIRRQPTFAFAASLAFAGLLMARKVQTQTGLRTNLLVISLGDSASGKNEARNCIRRALFAADCTHMIAGETIGSDSGLLDELASQGGHVIYQLDEIGHALTAMTGKRAQGYLAAIIPTLMKLQSSAGQTWIGKSLKKGKDSGHRADIEDPCIVVYGTSVPEKYYSAIDYSNIEDGFVPRFLVFQTHDPFPPVNYTPYHGPVPDTIIRHIQTWTADRRSSYIRRPAAGNARTVKHTEETMAAVRRFEKVVQQGYRDNKQKRLHAVWGRAQATADQLSLLFTCSANPEAEFMDIGAVNQACKLTEYLCQQQMLRLDSNISDGDYETDLKKILRTIEEAKYKGVQRSKLLQKHMGMPARRLNDIMTILLEGEKVIVKKEKMGKSRQASKVYYATRYAELSMPEDDL